MNGETTVLKDTPSIGVGILGYGYASRAHIVAIKRIREVYWPPAVLPRTVSICGRTESKGSIYFDLEEMNRLRVYLVHEIIPSVTGFHDVLVTEGNHPYFKEWWPTGHTLGWEHTFINQLGYFLDAIVKDKPVEPWGATLEDGYRNVVICDAMLKSAELGKKVEVLY